MYNVRMYIFYIYGTLYIVYVNNIYIYIYIIHTHILENPLHFALQKYLQFCSRCTAEEITPAEGEIFWEDGEFSMALNCQWRKATKKKQRSMHRRQWFFLLLLLLWII